jgi:hypothetical protein
LRGACGWEGKYDVARHARVARLFCAWRVRTWSILPESALWWRSSGTGETTHMRLRTHQVGEIVGIMLLLASTAMQLFYLEPLKREIEWRLVAFNTQQSAQIQLRTTFDNQIALLKLMNAPADQVSVTEAQRTKVLAQYKTSDANISDFMIEKERVESYLEVIVITMFALGSLLAGLGRLIEFQTAARLQRE